MQIFYSCFLLKSDAIIRVLGTELSDLQDDRKKQEAINYLNQYFPRDKDAIFAEMREQASKSVEKDAALMNNLQWFLLDVKLYLHISWIEEQ